MDIIFVAARVGFEPTKRQIEISKFMIKLRPCVPYRPLLSPDLAVDLAVELELSNMVLLPLSEYAQSRRCLAHLLP